MSVEQYNEIPTPYSYRRKGGLLRWFNRGKFSIMYEDTEIQILENAHPEEIGLIVEMMNNAYRVGAYDQIKRDTLRKSDLTFRQAVEKDQQ